MSLRRNESFLLRITIDESVAGEPPAWRGRIQHIGSGIDQQFDTLEELNQAIKNQIDFNPHLFPQPERSARAELRGEPRS